MEPKQTLYFGLAHATPTEQNTDPELRGARGAWFGALALADDEESFRERVRIDLEDMEYELTGIDDVRPFAAMLAETMLAPSLLELANQAAHENQTAFGPFYVYEEDADEEDEQDGGTELSPQAVVATSLEHELPLRLRRTPAPSERLEGFVVGIGARWLLLHELDHGLELDGYVAAPLDDAFDAWLLDSDRSGFVRTVLRLRKLAPTALENPHLDHAEGLLRWADAAHPLISVYVERDVPGVCYVGRVNSFGVDEFELALITPAARWEDRETFAYDAVTRVDFGGKYEGALALVAASRA